MNKEIKQCQNCRQDFTIEPDDFAFYEKIKVPTPTFCPDCREQRRIAFRNERALYKRKCDLCGKEVVSRVSPDKPYPMYCQKCWWSDKWDPLAYGHLYDFSRPFFSQFKELLLSIPHIALMNSNSVNSEWVNQETDDKNCYLNVGGHYNEDSAYNTYALYSKDCFDNFWVLRCELCCGCINCHRCYRTFFSEHCFDCRDTILSRDCRNCQHVFGCAGLRNKSYHIFNKPCTEKEYQKFIARNTLSSHENLRAMAWEAEKIWPSVPSRDRFVFKSVNVSGNFITESKNAHNVWNGEKAENGKHLYIVGMLKDSYDCTSYGWGELCYEGAHAGGQYNSKFFMYCLESGRMGSMRSMNLEYAYAVVGSSSCFGCACLKNQEYCILNKKYTKEEYEALVPKIIAHMNEMPYQGENGRVYWYGEFFPIEISPYGYNETAAMDYYPLTKEDALAKGYLWSDYESETKYEFSDYEIPDDIHEVKDDILEKVLKCEVSSKPYRIIPMELQFYRRMGLPVPHRAPLQRHKDRMVKLLPRKLFDRVCECSGQSAKRSDGGAIASPRLSRDKGQIEYRNTVKHFHGDVHCPNKIQTPYAPDRPELVYCEQCYQAEIA